MRPGTGSDVLRRTRRPEISPPRAHDYTNGEANYLALHRLLPDLVEHGNPPDLQYKDSTSLTVLADEHITAL
jgi:hypothetical protein